METDNRSSRNTVISLLYILSVACVAMGSSSVGVRLSSFMLSPYRIILLISLILTVLKRKIYFSVITSKYYLFWLLLIVYAGFSGIWVRDSGEWQTCMIYLIIGFAILISWAAFEDTYFTISMIRKILLIWLVIILLLGWYEVRTGNYYFLRNAIMIQRVSYIQNRVPIVFFTNTNNYALYVVFSYLFLTPYLFEGKNIYKVFYIICLVVGIPLLAVSKSRATLLGLILGYIVWWLIRGARNHSKKRIFLTLITLIIIVFVGLYFLDVLWDRFVGFFFLSGYGSFSESLSNMSRVNLIRNGLHMIGESLGFGVGAGNSRVADYHIYYTRGLVDLHNWWLLIFSEFGIIFGVVYIYLYFKQVRDMLRLRRKSSFGDSVILETFICIDIAFVICLISPSSVMSFEWLWLYWGFKLSWLNSYCRIMENDR